MEAGYIQANTNNLPTIDSSKKAEFFKENDDFSRAEFRNVIIKR